MNIDLHTHSTASDGKLTPRALVEAAVTCGIGVLALTDHDAIDGLEEAEDAAKNAGIAFIRGVEFEIDWPGIGMMEKRDFHLLGLGFKHPGESFISIINELKSKREARNKLVVGRMRELGIDADMAEIREECGISYIGRPHFAAYLVARKIVKNPEEAFRKYLGNGKPLYVPKGGVSLERAISAIHESGGLAVIAHPISLYISWGRLPFVLEYLKKFGLDGLEAYHPNTSLRASIRFCKLASDFDLLVSAGSDFHGSSRRDRKLGRVADGLVITDSLANILPYIVKL